MSDLRPISTLSALSKAFELIIKKQILTHLHENKLLCEFQSAYRPGHSTTSALLHITDDIRRNADANKFTVLTLLDFSKAFDSINHTKLCKKLKSLLKFSSSSCKLIFSYLNNRSQLVEVGGNSSDIMALTCGVPQGSILGPLLFSLYINDISSCFKFSKFHLYADDLQVYRCDRLTNKIISIGKLNEDLQRVVEWSTSNDLILNAKKTQAIIIHKHRLQKRDFPQVMLTNEKINYSDSVRNLGLVMNSTLSWDDHIDKVCGTVYGILRNFWKLTKLTSVKLRHRLFMSYVMPHIMYCDVVMYGMFEYSLNKLKLLFNAGVRYIFSLRKYDHISQFSKSILGCDLDTFFEFRTCSYIHKILTRKYPPYLYNKIELNHSIRTGHIKLPNNKYRIFNSSFFVQGMSKYNQLPHSIRSSTSPSRFVECYRRHFVFEKRLNAD